MCAKKNIFSLFLLSGIVSCSGGSNTGLFSINQSPQLQNATQQLVNSIDLDILNKKLILFQSNLTDPNWSMLTFGKTFTTSEIANIIEDLKLFQQDIPYLAGYLFSTPELNSALGQHMSKLIDDIYPVGGSYLYESVSLRRDSNISTLLAYITAPTDVPKNNAMIINLLNLFNKPIDTANANAQIKTVLGLQ